MPNRRPCTQIGTLSGSHPGAAPEKTSVKQTPQSGEAMKTHIPVRRPRLAAAISIAMVAGSLAASSGTAFAATPNTLDLKVLLIGDGASDATTAAWESALNTEGVPYTEVDAGGASSTAGTSTATGSW